MDTAKAAYDAWQKFWQEQNQATKHGIAPIRSWDELRPIDRDAWRVATSAADLHRAQINCQTLPEFIDRTTKQPPDLKCTVCDGTGTIWGINFLDGDACDSCHGTGKVT